MPSHSDRICSKCDNKKPWHHCIGKHYLTICDALMSQPYQSASKQ